MFLRRSHRLTAPTALNRPADMQRWSPRGWRVNDLMHAAAGLGPRGGLSEAQERSQGRPDNPPQPLDRAAHRQCRRPLPGIYRPKFCCPFRARRRRRPGRLSSPPARAAVRPERPAYLPPPARAVKAAVRPSDGLAGEVGINATARKAVNAGPARFGWLNPFPIRVPFCTDAFLSTGKLPGAAMIHRNPSAGGSYGCGPLDYPTEYRALRPATPHGTR